MSTSQKDKEHMQTMILLPFAALVIIVALIPFIKYVPIVFLAMPFALMFYDNLLAQSAFSKVKSTIWTLVFSAFILYFLFGFPNEKGYYGFIPLYPLKNILENLISLHDSFLSKFSKISPANVQKGLFGAVGFMEASRYFWYLLPVGFIEALLLYGLCEWRNKHFSTGLGTISKIALKPILRLIQKPILKALDKEWEPKSALFVTAVLYVAIMYSTEGEKYIAQKFSHSHPFMFLFFLIFTVGVFYFMGMVLLTARAFSQRTKLFHMFVPYVDLLLSPVIWLLSLDLSDNDNKIDFSKVVPLGTDFETKKSVVLTEKNLNYHTQVIGGSGAGKTNLIKNVIASRVLGNKGLIFLDLKADFDTVVWMKKLSVTAGRDHEFKLFSMANPEISLGYNPVARGSATEIHSRIMNAMKWSEEFYRKTSSHALSDSLILLCEIRDKYKKPFFLEELQKAVGEWNYLEYLVSEYEVSSNTKDIIKKRIDLLKTKEGSKQVQGISTDLLNITRSKAGSLLKARGDKIDIFESIQSGEVVYFLMDSMSDKESSELLGRLLLQDLIGATGMIYSSVKETDRKQTQVIIDEFASFASENFIDFINRARGAGLGVMVAHQSRGDLKSVHETFCDRVERNCATKLIFGTDNSEDAEYFASMVGTRQALKDTMQMQDGWLSTESTGMMSRREVEEFVIHPNQIKNLSQGELLRISRIIDPGVNLTRIYKAEEFSDVTVNFDKIENTEETVIERPSKGPEIVKPDEVFL